MVSRAIRVVLAASAAAASLGCGEGLPLPERIAFARPLAMRVEAIDANADPADPVRAEALPLEQVQIVPFFADPQGPLGLDAVEAGIEPVWISCALQPIEGLFSCLSNKLPLDRSDIPDCPAVDPSSLDPSSGEFPVAPSPCFITTGTPAQPQLTIPIDPLFLLGGDLEVTMVGHLPDGDRSTSDCLDRLLSSDADLDTDCIYAAQRVSVGPDTALSQFAIDLGFADPEDVGPIPDEPEAPDTHPRIETMSVIAFDEDDDEVLNRGVMPGDTIQAQVGQRLELQVEAPQSDLQTYLIQRDMDELVDRDEAYEGQWFITWGDLLSPESNDPTSINTWTLERGDQDEDDLPPDGRATLIYVLRDGRQGVDWWWFHVEVTE